VAFIVIRVFVGLCVLAMTAMLILYCRQAHPCKTRQGKQPDKANFGTPVLQPSQQQTVGASVPVQSQQVAMVPLGPQSTMQVCIPENCPPGSAVQVQAPTGQMIQIQVPPGAAAGSLIEVALPPVESGCFVANPVAVA
jgi:hypothetical protein